MEKILVANRGEIALRVMRTCREMGIKTVAVYSTADAGAPFVEYADEAVFIGEAPSKESYLVHEKILDACKKTGAQGIHPGYGFLSENAEFARKAKKAGINFIGPEPESMEIMGSKLAAKEAAKKYNIPLVPGTDGAITDLKEARSIAGKIGYPVLIKASAGGGGKGMRLVQNDNEFEEQYERAVSEAVNSFGDGSVFIEKFVTKPRHIEIQVMADKHGNCCYLFERECSIQRRHQKVVEEAPSSVLTPGLRKKMGECAVMVAKSCDYVGAGTVEFLLDDKHNFYFLEMNTRLQVEHPVTEMITGIDLVREQIEVARGKKLSFMQADLKINGHAIEIRVYAEDPANNFLPDIGTLEVYQVPRGNGVRVDDAYQQGMEIPIYYDPMIAKLVTHGNTREEARKKMLRAIADYKIFGVETTLGFCRFALEHEAFIKGDFDTNFVPMYFRPGLLEQTLDSTEEVAAIGVFAGLFTPGASAINPGNIPVQKTSNWRTNRLKSAD
ncbi:MAG TPA: acetyl-CoA carboxylase biotin carboxylase subunit [Flavobacteriales bacterium]|nr:acetyl-CoA carboxylase biotin carboxylase subunit [Flavobacteriales bacterium]